ncbi:MAG: hypothetical protein SFW62_04765 [Alphaproteobacteria bacterium]|nr:hypothetical protein [Alphaproteobacteria bacterium]
MIKLGKELSVKIGGKVITGSVVGIDCYRLENFEGRTLQWASYTLTSPRKHPFTRYWITDWGKRGWVLWLATRKKTPAGRFLAERSGVAGINFSGEQGASTPVAALVVYQKKDGSYYSLERFAGSRTLFFEGRKVKRPQRTGKNTYASPRLAK